MLTMKTNIVHSVLFSVLLLALACGQRPNAEEQIAQSPDSVHRPPITVARSGLGLRANPQGNDQTRSADRPKLIAHLKDGSQIVGIPRCDVISVRTAHGSLDLPFVDLLSIEFKPGSDSLIISFQNGDRLHGVLASDICEIVAIVGNVSLVPKNLVSIVVDMPTTGILEDALLGYYPFNGNANDESTHGKNGTVHGAVLTSDRFGRRNSAYRFDGEDSYISFARGWIPADIEGFSVSLWLFAEERTKGWALYTGAIMGESAIGIDDDGLFFAANFVPNSNSWIKAGVPAITGRFVHIVGVYRRGQTIQLWINGELRQETSIPMVDLNHGSTTHNASIGSYSPNHFNHYRGIWLGVIDDVLIYRRALSAWEIRHLYQTER